jgi:hypothetical protein
VIGGIAQGTQDLAVREPDGVVERCFPDHGVLRTPSQNTQ